MVSTNLFITITLHILMMIFIYTCNGKKLPSTLLIFGDSTMDTGNNNYIRTILRANHPPYGQNFPGNIPTGRFSNGKLVPDFLASILGIKETVPPFLQPNLSDEEILSGVCFASAGSGLDDMTTAATSAIPVSKQIDMLKNYLRRVEGIVGDEEKAKKVINDALVVLSAGTNDFGFNFYGVPTRKFEFKTIGAYQDFLLDRLNSFVKELYELGCRSIIITGLPPMGCLPLQIATHHQGHLIRKCLEDQNTEARAYNLKLSKMLTHLQDLLPQSIIVYADIYSHLINMINHPEKFGFVETTRGCCGTGLIEAAMFCNPTTPKCRNASQFIFWDSIHPTHSAYQFLTENLVVELYPKIMFNQTL